MHGGNSPEAGPVNDSSSCTASIFTRPQPAALTRLPRTLIVVCPTFLAVGISPVLFINGAVVYVKEELASMIAIMKETDYMKKPTFLKNTWAAFKEVRRSDTACAASVPVLWVTVKPKLTF